MDNVEKKRFEGGQDADTNLRDLQQSMYLQIQNGRRGISKYGRSDRVESVNGTVQITDNVQPPYGISQCIGSTTYVTAQGHSRIVWANWNSFDDNGIYCYDLTDDKVYAVLYDSQVIGGLNFKKDYRINRNMKVMGDLLTLCDGENNEILSISIEAGIKANQSSYQTDVLPYQFPLDYTQITLVKSPSQLSPNIQKATDGTFLNNFIANESFQFAYAFTYYTNETSVVGTYSSGTRLNKIFDTENYVIVTMDVFQKIPSTVRIVDLIVRVSDGERTGGNIARVVKTWDKEIQSERNEIIEHNNGTTLLTFNFYNNISGRTLPQRDVLKPFDVVPNHALTLEQARNRNFLGNIIEGYDTPPTTSLVLTPVTEPVGGSVVTKNVILFDIYYLSGIQVTGYIVYLTNVAQPGYYSIIVYNSFIQPIPTPLPPPPASFPFASMVYRGTTQSEVVTSFGSSQYLFSFFTNTSYNIQITGLTLQAYDIFKTRSQYKAGVVFYDFAMRKCGVVANDSTVFNIPKRDYAFSNAVTSVVWTLSNANRLIEIPEKAYYYTPVRTLNQLTGFFIENYTNTLRYATKNATGEYEFTNSTFTSGTVGIGLETTPLLQSGLGYVFSEGDIAILTFNDDQTVELPVIGQDGQYIIVKSGDYGNLSNRQVIYQIYNPYKGSEQEPFYEVGEMYRINNPNTDLREYSTLSDFFKPDTYIVRRIYNNFQYFAEAMCPNDLFYQRWDNDCGKPNFITKLGKTYKYNFFRWSNTFIPNTATNGLSTFDALDQSSVGETNGAIQNLVLTDKVQDKGTVMLAICYNETSSIYLGETQIADGTGATKFFAQSSGTVGTINPLKGSFGSKNPETMITRLGLVFWYDLNNGSFVQYSPNGLEPVSRYGMNRLFQRYAQDYADSNKNNLANINGFSHIPTYIDPFHKEVGVTLPALIYENYAAILPSFNTVPSYATSIVDRFDIYDKLAKSMSFTWEENLWKNNYQFAGEWYDYVENRMFGWKDGRLWEFNVDTANQNSFFGTQYPTRIIFAANYISSALKLLNNIAIESNVAPNFTVAKAGYPNLQITDLENTQYTDQEGVFYSEFLMDRLSPNVQGTADEKIYTGDPLTDFAISIMLEFQATDSLIYVNAVDVGWDIAKGQKQIINIVNK